MSYSQDRVKDALDKVDGLVSYKPPDDARNWKPCDVMVWWRDEATSHAGETLSAWVEVKQCDNLGVYTVELRPSQRLALHGAGEIGLPFYLVVYWKARKMWSLHRLRPEDVGCRWAWEEATSRHGVEATPSQLHSALWAVLNGSAGL